MYFRVEDENGLSPNLREYGCNNSYNTKVNASNADKLIAQEIREQVNNSNSRSVFSYSKSLGIVLFKYNFIADNPIHFIPTENIGSYVDLDIVDENGMQQHCPIRYDISDLDYPLRRYFEDKEIILKNYIIEVDDNRLLNRYLENYTSVGKKKMASCQKDREVIIRHVVNDYIIEDYINAVYLIYALQYKTRFLNDSWVMNSLVEIFRQKIKNPNECEAFCYLISYLSYNWDYEEKTSRNILKESLNQGRTVPCYDGYSLFFDLMNGNYESAWYESADSLLDNVTPGIWNVFKTWKRFH